MVIENNNSGVGIKEDYAFTFSKNSDELQNCIALRNQVYKTINGDHIDITADAYDKAGDILVITKNKKIIGGTRISCVEPNSSQKLPLEEYNFDLNAVLPNINNYRICECSRTFIVPSDYSNELFAPLMDVFFKEAEARKCDYMFYASRLPMIKHFEFTANALGYQSERTSQKVLVNYNSKNIGLYLCYVKLSSQQN